MWVLLCVTKTEVRSKNTLSNEIGFAAERARDKPSLLKNSRVRSGKSLFGNNLTKEWQLQNFLTRRQCVLLFSVSSVFPYSKREQGRYGEPLLSPFLSYFIFTQVKKIYKFSVSSVFPYSKGEQGRYGEPLLSPFLSYFIFTQVKKIYKFRKI